MKKILKITVIMSLVITLLDVSIPKVFAETPVNSDIEIIKERLKSYFLELDTIDDGAKVETVYVSKAEDYLNSINEDGSWSDVDYYARENAANGKPWSPYLALDRMQALAIAYWQPENSLYKDERVIESLDNALSHWNKVKPSSTNWWENDIGVNLRFSRIGLFLENNLSETSISIIVNSLNEEGVYHGTGQNNLWYDQNAIYRALITNDAAQLKKVIEECLEYVLILQKDNITKEALQVDNSLYFHGVQFYSNGYGLSMFRDMSFWIYILDNTEFALSKEVVNRMGDYMLDGTRWTLRSDIMELYLGYRPYKYDVGFDNYAMEYVEPLKRMISVDEIRGHEYQAVLDNLLGNRNNNGANGNNYMWRVGYGAHMRDAYGVNIKMDSKRIIGGEWRGSWPAGKDAGNSVFWSASASSSIIVDGDEYTPIYPTFDWAHVPGVTAPNFVPSNYSNYGRVNNNDDHALGVSDGTYGSTSYKLNKSNTQANKSYFFFDDEFVALGSGIKSTSNNPIHTTLNQSKADEVFVDGISVEKQTQGKNFTASWIYNDDIAYIFPEKTSVVVNNYKQDMPSLWTEDDIANTPETFSAWINHGVKPTSGSYEYIVVPNIKIEDINDYMETTEIEILSNTDKIHAVKHHGLQITQINFFEPGTLEYAPGKSITVDKIVNLIIDESQEDTVISLAMTDTSYNERVEVILNSNGRKESSDIVLYPAPYTGKTISFKAGQSNKIISSSEVDGHDVMMAFDGNLETYWKSEKESNAWIQKSLEGNMYVHSIKIDWGNEPATEYKIQGSIDGHNFYDLETKESKDLIIVNEIVSYIKIVLLDGEHNGEYSIKEVDINFGTNIALNKNVEVSSVSKTDTNNVARLLNDGDKATRWSSARDSDEEWIIVDLGGVAEISAINILWEDAKSNAYSIEISNNKEEWTRIKNINNSDNLLDSFTFDDKLTGRYLKINSSKSKLKKYGISIFELEVYGNVEMIEERTNLALNKDSQASSEYVNQYTGFVHESKYAFDNSKESDGDRFQSRWVSNRNSADEWIMVDLGENYLIDEVVLDWEGAHASEYLIQVSEDKNIWIDVYHETEGKAGEVTIKIDPIPARYVKMQGIQHATKYGYSLWEFEVYGEEITEEILDTKKLEMIIEDFQKLDPEQFTKKEFNNLRTLVDSAIALLEEDTVTQTQVDNILRDIENKLSKLEYRDDAGLLMLIEEANTKQAEQFTVESFKFLRTALEAAVLLVDEGAEVNEEYLAMEAFLQNAIDSLVILQLDTDILIVLLEKAKEIDITKYTEESVVFLKKMIEETEQILIKSESNNITQLEIDQMRERLDNAIKGLVKTEDPNNPENSGLPELPGSKQDGLIDGTSDDNDNLPITGVSNHITWLSGVFFIVGLLVLVQGKKRKKV